MKSLPPSARHLIVRGLTASALVLGGAIVGFAISQEFTGEFTPGTYSVPTLARVTREVEKLRKLLNNSDLSPSEVKAQIDVLAADDKPGIHIETVTGDQTSDTTD